MLSYISPEARAPARHPLRRIRGLVRAVLKDLRSSDEGCARADGDGRGHFRISRNLELELLAGHLKRADEASRRPPRKGLGAGTFAAGAAQLRGRRQLDREASPPMEGRWPEPRLLPVDPLARAEARMTEEGCDTTYEAVNWGFGELLWFRRSKGPLAETLSAATSTKRPC